MEEKEIVQKLKNHLKTIDPKVLKYATIKGYMLAGGSILDILDGREIKDYDFFPQKEPTDPECQLKSGEVRSKDDSGLIYALAFACNLDEEKDFIVTLNAITVVKKYQFIRQFRVQGSYLEVLNKFDLKICRIGYDIANDKLIVGDGWKEAYEAKRINPDFKLFKDKDLPYSILHRVVKYSRKGFYISHGDLTKIFLKMSTNDMDDIGKIRRAFSEYVSESLVEENETKDFFQDLIKFEQNKLIKKKKLKKAAGQADEKPKRKTNIFGLPES